MTTTFNNTNANGDLGDAGNWDNGLPSTGDDAVIAAGFTTGSITAATVTVNSNVGTCSGGNFSAGTLIDLGNGGNQFDTMALSAVTVTSSSNTLDQLLITGDLVSTADTIAANLGSTVSVSGTATLNNSNIAGLSSNPLTATNIISTGSSWSPPSLTGASESLSLNNDVIVGSPSAATYVISCPIITVTNGVSGSWLDGGGTQQPLTFQFNGNLTLTNADLQDTSDSIGGVYSAIVIGNVTLTGNSVLQGVAVSGNVSGTGDIFNGHTVSQMSGTTTLSPVGASSFCTLQGVFSGAVDVTSLATGPIACQINSTLTLRGASMVYDNLTVTSTITIASGTAFMKSPMVSTHFVTIASGATLLVVGPGLDDGNFAPVTKSAGGKLYVFGSTGITKADVISTGTIPVASDVRFGIAVGSTTGTLAVPASNKVLTGTAVDATTGTLTLPTASQVLTTIAFGVGGNGTTGNVVLPGAAAVISGTSFGPSGGTAGTVHVPSAGDVRLGTAVGVATTGTANIPAANVVLTGNAVDAGTGTLTLPTNHQALSGVSFGVGGNGSTGDVVLPSANNVLAGVAYGSLSGLTGTYVPASPTYPTTSDVRSGVVYGAGTGLLAVPLAGNVKLGIVYDNGSVGTYNGPGVVPFVSSGGVVNSLAAFQNTNIQFAWKIVDANGVSQNLKPGGTANTIKFIVFEGESDVVLGSSATIILSESDPSGNPGVFDKITAALAPADLPNAGSFKYEVRDYTTGAESVYATGPFTVMWAPAP